jgi:hypothetical protein
VMRIILGELRQQLLQRSQNERQGCAEFVAHVGEELVLERVELGQAMIERRQFRVDLLELAAGTRRRPPAAALRRTVATAGGR